MKIDIIEYLGDFWWVSKETNDACGKEYATKDEAIADAKKRFGEVFVMNQEVKYDRKYSDRD